MKARLELPTTTGKRAGLRGDTAGVTLVETIIALLIFTMLSTAVATSLIQLRKQGERNIRQVLAQATAEGLIEQIRRTSYADLSNVTDNPPIELLFIRANANNRATVEPLLKEWSTNDTDFEEIGVLSDPADPTSPKLGVLIDVDYKDDSGKIIRSMRYMKMKVNLTHKLNANKDAVEVCLRFQWAVPDRLGSEVFYATREIRSVISKMPTY